MHVPFPTPPPLMSLLTDLLPGSNVNKPAHFSEFWLKMDNVYFFPLSFSNTVQKTKHAFPDIPGFLIISLKPLHLPFGTWLLADDYYWVCLLSGTFIPKVCLSFFLLYISLFLAAMVYNLPGCHYSFKLINDPGTLFWIHFLNSIVNKDIKPYKEIPFS